MWNFDFSVLTIILRTTIIYCVILLGMRISGKRELGQMTPIDLVLILLISNAVQNAMTGPDTSVTGGIIAAATLLILNWVTNRLIQKDRSLRKLLEGTPTILVHNGKLIHKNLLSEKISSETLNQAFREHGVTNISDIHLATLEIDGSISVIRIDELPAQLKPHHNFRFIEKKNS